MNINVVQLVKELFVWIQIILEEGVPLTKNIIREPVKNSMNSIKNKWR